MHGAGYPCARLEDSADRMDLTVLFFLTSGLMLGWSLGANDAANVFGTAVGTRMVRFGTAALVCSASMANSAEDVADALQIYTIKRRV